MAKPATIKTAENAASVDDFINAVPDEQKRTDSLVLLKMMQKISKEKPKMWGSTIIGFGKQLYKSPASGREVEWFTVGFSPRKANLTVYLIDMRLHEEALKTLGRHKLGGGCLYINKLADVDVKVLEKMIRDVVIKK